MGMGMEKMGPRVFDRDYTGMIIVLEEGLLGIIGPQSSGRGSTTRWGVLCRRQARVIPNSVSVICAGLRPFTSTRTLAVTTACHRLPHRV